MDRETSTDEHAKVSGARKAALVLLTSTVTGLFAAMLFWAGGGIGWVAGWAYLGLLVIGQTIVAFYLKKKDPELLRRRGKAGEGTKGWDKIVLAFFGLSYLAVVVVGALDGGRFGWAPLPWWLWPVGAMLYTLGTALVTWAMSVNTHFEKTVRIQHDRGHRVVESGPYRIVRHPGYVGAAVAFPLATPFLLGSFWALVPAAACVACLVIRTALEDRMLRAELEGYEDFARRTRYRLAPGLW